MDYFSEYLKNALQHLQLHCSNYASAKAYEAVNCIRYRINEHNIY